MCSNDCHSREENARLFALINYAKADATIAVLDCEYHYDFWCPIIAILQSTGSIQADPNWLPLASPSDSDDTNFTPASTSFASDHGAVSGSVFEALRLFYKGD